MSAVILQAGFGSRDQHASASFLLFTQYLIAHIDNKLLHHAFHLKYALLQCFDDVDLPAEARQALRQCLLKKGKRWPELALPETRVRELFQAFYNVLCENDGPVETDLLVSRLIQRVDATPTGEEYPCRRLL